MSSLMLARSPLTTPASMIPAVRIIMLAWTRKAKTRVPRRSGPKKQCIACLYGQYFGQEPGE